MHASEEMFHTGWFLESLITQTLVIHIIRTNKTPFIESMPSRALMITSLLIISIGIYLPYSPIAAGLGLVQPPLIFYGYLALIVISYLLLVQFAKKLFIKKFGYE
jgi:Mg2+-importing ATPase